MRLNVLLLFLALGDISLASVPGGLGQTRHLNVGHESELHRLDRRRGGGGHGGRGRGRGSSHGGSGKGSSSDKSHKSNSGGTSKSGSGPPRSYGGTRYYGGGASVPYRAGGKSPGNILPFMLVGHALVFWPGHWLYGAYMYPLPDPYHYRNMSSDQDEFRHVICGCAQYAVCGCDSNNDTAYVDDLIGDGDYKKFDQQVVTIAEVNGTVTLLINGTLPNGTTAASGASRYRSLLNRGQSPGVDLVQTVLILLPVTVVFCITL